MNNRLIFILFAVLSFSPANWVMGQNSDRAFLGARQENNVLLVETSDGDYRIKMYPGAGVEVVFTHADIPSYPSYSLLNPSDEVTATLTRKDAFLEFEGQNMKVVIQKQPFALSFFRASKRLLSEEHGFFQNDSTRGFRFNLEPEEKITGGGERVLGMNRRGERLQLYNKASYGYETHADLMYYSMPVAISSKKYMLVFDNGASGYMDIGKTEPDILQFEATGGRMSYWVAASDTWQGLIRQFTLMCGRQPMLPRWALGNIASRFGYHSQHEVEQVVDEYIRQDFPLDAIVLDLYWFGKEIRGSMGNLEWYTDSFPDPEKMMKGLREKGVKTILITEPFILTNSSKYNEVKRLNLAGTDSAGVPYLFDFYFGNTSLLDIFKKETKDWFWEIYKKHTLAGVEGWWGDLGEPEVHPNDLMHVNGKAEDVHNYYGHEWARTVYEGFSIDFPEKRPLVLMRAGFVGSQRYGLVPWSGDVRRTWGGLKPQVEISLTMGMQGLAYMHSDLGGFAEPYEDAELYTRWLQYGVFQPVYRPHAQEEVPSEPIFWEDSTKNIVRDFIKLRYALIPYVYTLTFENATSGTPMMRPLMYMEDDLKLFDRKDSYLWGDNFLVAPVVEKGQKHKDVYLPKGADWVDYWTGEQHEGGQQITIPLNLETIPVFVKTGSFVPMVPVVQTMDAYSSKELLVHYYHHNNVTLANGYMYEDDGETKNAFEKKAYEILRFSAQNSSDTLHLIYTPEGYAYAGKPPYRNVQFVVHGFSQKPAYVQINGQKFNVKSGQNKKIKGDHGVYWDKTTGRVLVKFRSKTSTTNVIIGKS